MSRLHPDTLRESMRKIPFLAALPVASLDAIGPMLEARRYEPEQIVYKEGQPGDSMLMVVSGRLAVRVRSATSTQEVEVAGVYPGEVVGEGACVDPGPRSATVVATKTTLVLELSRTVLKTLLERAPDVAVVVVGAMIALLARRVRDTNARIESEMQRRGIEPAGKNSAASAGPAPAVGGADDGRIDLRQVACLKGFTDVELQALVKAAPPLRYDDRTVLCREGEPGDSCFIVAKGSVSIVRQIGGHERTLSVLPGGALVGQMALIDRAPRSATVRTRGETVVLTLAQRAFDQLLRACHPFAVKFQEQIAIAGVKQLRLANQRFAGLVDRPAPAAVRPVAPQAAPPGAAASKTGRPAPGTVGVAPPVMTEDPKVAEMLAYMQTALGEWNMSLDDLENVRFERSDILPMKPRP